MDKPNAFHNVVAHTDKSVAEKDQRLVVITFKMLSDEQLKKKGLTKETYKKPQNRCVSIPYQKVQIGTTVLADALQSAFEDMQEACIRKLIVDGDATNKAKLTISDDEISFDAVAEFVKINGTSGSLSGDAIAAWFTENIAEKLYVGIAGVLELGDTPSDAETAKVEAAVQQHQDLLRKLSDKRVMLAPHVAQQLLKAVELNKELDSMHIALVTKLKKLTEVKTVELLGL